MAKIEKIKDLPELGLTEPNLLHIQESYARQVAHSRPLTAKKKRKSDVRATGAKWFRQKGTGRARQGERTNPHLHGGGLAFPPHPRLQRKRLNKRVRISAQRSAVLAHVLAGSAFCLQDKGFQDAPKTKDVFAGMAALLAEGSVCLVLPAGVGAWRSGRNIVGLVIREPEQVNVRDLVECENLVFTADALDQFKQLLAARNAPAAEDEAPVADDETPGAEDEAPAGEAAAEGDGAEEEE